MIDEEIARAIFEAFNRGDREAQKRLTSKDVEIVPLRAALEGNAFHGHDGLDQFWEASEESWSEISADVRRVEGGSEAVFVLARLRGRGRQTGAAVEMELGCTVSVRDGEATRVAVYTDIAEARGAAGIED